MILKKKPPLLLTVGTALVLIGGGAIAYWGAMRQGELSKDLPAGAKVIPQQVLMTATLTTDESQWRKLRQFGAPESQADFDGVLARWRDRLMTDNGYNFKRDIQPWVGEEVTIAFFPGEDRQANDPSQVNTQLVQGGNFQPYHRQTATPLKTLLVQGGDTSEDLQSSFMLVLPIANPEKAKEILAKPKDPAVSWVGRNYKGIQIQEIQTRNNQRLAAAILGAELVVTPNTKLAEQAIDTYRGAKPVMQTPGYAKAFRQIAVSPVFAKLYINMPRAVEALFTHSAPPLPQSGLTQFQGNQGLAATVTLESGGIHFQGASWLAPGSNRTYEISNDAGQLPRRLPTNTLMMVSGGNLQRFWQDYSQGADQSSLLPLSPDNLRVLVQSYTGLDLDDDLMTWMEGEFALAVVSPNPREKTQHHSTAADPINALPGLLFLVQVNDRAAAEGKLAQLNEVIASRYRYQVNTVQVADQAVVQWISPFKSTKITHGWLDNNVIFLALGDPIVKAIVPRPNRSLAETQLFQTATSFGPTSNNGHFFLNFNQLNEIAGNDLLPELPPNGKKITAAIEAIGVTASIQTERSARYDIFVALPKGKRPAALPSPDEIRERDKTSEKETTEE
ncbi:MAG: DUF3352 domain-containing protein [Leptolyngbyaceae cyanobacterium MO_188.B28]|nr:DUF3352 domain-containing protein [Leptolyngbyaceae cyanobacterium MO_188.B28]